MQKPRSRRREGDRIKPYATPNTDQEAEGEVIQILLKKVKREKRRKNNKNQTNTHREAKNKHVKEPSIKSCF